MIIYIGRRNRDGGVDVSVGKIGEAATRPLPTRLELRAHSPTGFEWGYAGSGPAQLALAMLSDYLGAGESGDYARALDLYQAYKELVITHLPHAGWRIMGREIENAIATINREQSEGTTMTIPILDMKPTGNYAGGDGPIYKFSAGGFPSRGVRALPTDFDSPEAAHADAKQYLADYQREDPYGNMGCVLGVTMVNGKYRGVVNTYHSNT